MWYRKAAIHPGYDSIEVEETIVSLRTLDDYLKLVYTVEIYLDSSDEPTGFFGRFAELPGSVVQAETLSQLEEKLEVMKRTWLETALAEGREIPEPQPTDADATDNYPRRDELE